ncbi:MAG: accessory gene regulator B family protein [Bacilli bacterium]
MVKKISELITDFILSENTEYDQSVYSFGIYIFLYKLIFFIIVMLIGILQNEIVLSFIFFTTFMLLRKYTGGFHFENEYTCFIISIILAFYSLVLTKNNMHLPLIFLIVVDILTIAGAPIENRNKPLDLSERKAYKKQTIYTLICINGFLSLAYLLNLMKISYILQNTISLNFVLMCFGILKIMFFEKNSKKMI